MTKPAAKTTKTPTKAKKPASKPAETPVSPLYGSLSKLLADEMMLYTKLRKYHWNVTGPNFQSLHVLFEQQYTELAVMIDDLAEFIRTLRAPAIGTMKEFTEHTRLTEKPGVNPSANEMVKELAEDHTKIIGYLNETIEEADDLDAVAAEDLLTQMLRAHEKSEWMLRVTIE